MNLKKSVTDMCNIIDAIDDYLMETWADLEHGSDKYKSYCRMNNSLYKIIISLKEFEEEIKNMEAN